MIYHLFIFFEKEMENHLGSVINWTVLYLRVVCTRMINHLMHLLILLSERFRIGLDISIFMMAILLNPLEYLAVS